MIAELILAVSMVLLLSGWFASFFDRHVRLGLVPMWRRVLSWIALVALTVSLIGLLRYSVIPRNEHLNVILPFGLTGLALAGLALLTCWFSSLKTLACLLPSTLLIGLSWVLQLAAA